MGRSHATCRQIANANDAKGNLLAAAYFTGKDEERAKQMAFDFLELLEKIDYNKYFESMKGVPVSGAKAAEYSKFSKRAAVAAAAQLDEFLKLMDREQLDAARSQVEAMAPPPPAPAPVAEEVEGARGSRGRPSPTDTSRSERTRAERVFSPSFMRAREAFPRRRLPTPNSLRTPDDRDATLERSHRST